MKTQAQQIKMVGLAFDALSHVFYSKNTNYAEQLLAQCIAEEKSHRGFANDFGVYHPNAATIRQCAKAFAVKRVAEYLLTTKPLPSGEAFLHIQKSCFWAAGIADEFKSEIQEAWINFDIRELSELDYVMFVSPEKFEPKAIAA